MDFYLIAIIVLFALAVSDLVVGVSNDAVNFLNSAIGSRVATRNTIMLVASAGILIGATFSSGMMEVARKGIFNPQLFYFSDIMTIFLAVMITDIILLDLFNTFGLPTSTTVSIVFELLGAAVAVSLIKIISSDSGYGLAQYINTSSAILIISGIFLSVLIAFAIGALVQYLSRLLFTFNVRKGIRTVGILWSGLALAALSYFLLIKGIRGASFVSEAFISWVQNNTLALLALSFLFWSVLMWGLQRLARVHILRVVVLFGTFALAMAFAGNDLVNFIGVPIAGLESYTYFNAGNTAPGELLMGFLAQPIQTDTYLLVMAGGIMITTLWFSKKARSVTETEVNLGRQDEGDERFRSNRLSRGIVRYTMQLGSGLGRVLPDHLLSKAEKRFNELAEESHPSPADKPAFDLVRASVNLTVASILIAIATSYKLPLSTTYVSFMVAMGTSLADRAWGRSSAVFRVAGVINVIGGWFFTAIVAFAASATFAICIYFFDLTAVVVLLVLAVLLISRTFMHHRRKEKEKAARAAFNRETRRLEREEVVESTVQKVAQTLGTVGEAYSQAIDGLFSEDRSSLRQTARKVRQLKRQNEDLKRQLYRLTKRLEPGHTGAGKLYLLVYDLQQDLLQSISLIVETCREHVENSLEPVKGQPADSLVALKQEVGEFFREIVAVLWERESGVVAPVMERKTGLLLRLEAHLEELLEDIRSNGRGMRNSLLLFTLLLETKDLLAVAARFAKLYRRVGDNPNGDGTIMVQQKKP